ncbi:unnamed protein product [Mucor fragilis]
MDITGCFAVLTSKRSKYLSNAMGPKGTDLPLLWGFVRDAGDFSGGFFRSGDATAAKLSCQLSVHLASSVPLVVHDPAVKHVMAQTFHDDDDVRLQPVYYCR